MIKKRKCPSVVAATFGPINRNKNSRNIISQPKYKVKIELDLETACELSDRADQRNLLIEDYIRQLIKDDIN
ncbi:hypothetical protein MYX76_03665 [Desulfobacterota bacterium AH_259_B03_O07]|nr:hypothetical protein [Desulfobacterota bacterium AH_259_B03_O07]